MLFFFSVFAVTVLQSVSRSRQSCGRSTSPGWIRLTSFSPLSSLLVFPVVGAVVLGLSFGLRHLFAR
jgi:hypothetical protein